MSKNAVFFKCIVFVVIFIMVFASVNKVLVRKDYTKYSPYYEYAEDYEVLFWGASHALNAIFPQELWKDYGMTSYNMSQAGELMAVTYYNVKNAISINKPKLVVLDLISIHWNRELIDTADWVNPARSLEHMPLSKNKIDAVNDVFNDNKKKVEILFPFIAYHSRYKELEKNDFIPDKEVELGAYLQVGVYENNYTLDKSLSLESLEEHHNEGIEYLIKIIELCKDNNIQILLINIPHIISVEGARINNYIGIVAEKYGIDYIDLVYEELVNYNMDFIDAGRHLNASGGRKVTDYIGEYILNNYDIKDYRRDKNYSHFHCDYQEYEHLKIDWLNNNIENIKSYLLLLYDKNFDYAIRIKSDSKLLRDSIIVALLENIGINTSDIKRKYNYYYSHNNAYGDLICRNVDIYFDEKDFLINDNNAIKYKEDGTEYDIQIYVFNQEGEIISSAEFDEMSIE